MRHITHLLDTEGEREFLRTLPREWTASKPVDYGLDFLVEIFEDQVPTGEWIGVQLKSKSRGCKRKLTVRIREGKLRQFRRYPFTVVIVGYCQESGLFFADFSPRPNDDRGDSAWRSVTFTPEDLLSSEYWVRIRERAAAILRVRRRLGMGEIDDPRAHVNDLVTMRATREDASFATAIHILIEGMNSGRIGDKGITRRKVKAALELSRKPHILSLAVTTYTSAGIPHEAGELVDSLLAISNKQNSIEDQLSALRGLVTFYSNTQQPESAEQALGQLKRLTTLGSDADRLLLLEIEADCLFEAGQHKRAIELYEQLIPIYEAMPLETDDGRLDRGITGVRANLAACYTMLGDLELAIGILAESLSYYLRCGNLKAAAIDRVNLGRTFLLKGDFRAATTQMEKALETYRDLGLGFQAADVTMLLADVAFFSRDSALYRARLHQAHNQAQGTPNHGVADLAVVLLQILEKRDWEACDEVFMDRIRGLPVTKRETAIERLNFQLSGKWVL